MNVLQSLTELYNSQSIDSVYRTLAKKILENLSDMRHVTIYDLAELTNSSRTTIWRLVQKLGYKNFSDFRHALQSAASQYNYYNRMMPSSTIHNSDDIVKAVIQQLKDASSIYLDMISADLITDLTSELHKATRIRFYIPFRLSFIYSFQQNLWANGKDTAYYCLIPDMLNDADSLDENSIVIISPIEFAETIDMTDVFKKLKETGAVIWLTGNRASQYTDYADRTILSNSSDPAGWILAFECFLLTLSEQYRENYIDK